MAASHCEACGRFAQYPRDFTHDTICCRCENDPRPGVQRRRREAIAAFRRSFGRASEVRDG